MKRKLKIVPLLAAALTMLTACAGNEKAQPIPSAAIEQSGSSLAGQPAEGEELMCLAESREEAEKISEQYGIELVGWEMRVATFHTEEDPYAVIRRGKDQGWPALEINHVVQLDDPVPERGSISNQEKPDSLSLG